MNAKSRARHALGARKVRIRPCVFLGRNSRHAALSLFVLVLMSTPTDVQAGAAQLLDEGIALLGEGNYATALERFEAAGREVPAAPEPYFFAGAALNRLGRPPAALPMLDRAAYLYAANPAITPHAELDFERGWALLGLGRFAAATRALTRYETQSPERGQTAEFLGRAAVGSGDYAAAMRWFDTAEARDPNLAGTIALARAAMAEKRGDTEGARRALAAALDRPENARLNRLLAARIPPTPEQVAANFGVTMGLGAGHNSNALGLSDDQPITSSGVAQEDNFRRFLLSGFYQWRPRDWSVVASYSLQADQYDDVETVDQLDNQVGLRAQRALTSRLSVSFELQDRYTRIDGEGLLNEISASPAVSWSLNEQITFELGYEFSDGDYLTRPSAPALDRDHHTHGFAPALRWSLPVIASQLQAGYTRRWISAAGDDFDAEADAVTVRFDSALPWRVSSRAVAFYESRDFDSPNSLSATGDNRDDDFYYLSVFLQRPLGDVPGLSDRLRVYAQYDYGDRSSTIDFYSYHQHTFSAGVLLAF